MTLRRLIRLLALLLPVIVAACGAPEEPMTSFQPLRYDYLPPIGLNVAAIDIRQQFFPSGAKPDVTAEDPVPPIAALKAMAQDRLKAFGTTGRAIFNIQDATLTRRGDAIDGAMAVSLTIAGDDNAQLGVARAQINRHFTGTINGLHRTLYDFTKAMMDDMNVEFEYQVRHNLKQFLVEPEAPEAPVQQTPLDGHQAPPVTAPSMTAPSMTAPSVTAPPGAEPPLTPAPGVSSLAPPSFGGPGMPTSPQPTPLSPSGASPNMTPAPDPYGAPRADD